MSEKINVNNEVNANNEVKDSGEVSVATNGASAENRLSDADVERLAALHDEIVKKCGWEKEIPWKVTRRDLEQSRMLRMSLLEAEEELSADAGTTDSADQGHGSSADEKQYNDALRFTGIGLAWEEIRLPVFSYPRDENGEENRYVDKVLNPMREKTAAVQDIIGYTFFNEWLLYQSLIRRDYASHIKEPGDNEVLEHIGDTAISYYLERVMLDQYTNVKTKGTVGGMNHRFFCDISEKRMSETKSYYGGKDHLSERCKELGLDKYILFGPNDLKNGADKKPDAKEDLMEAIIGAVAIDCRWDYEVLGTVIEHMLDVHLDYDGWHEEWDLYKRVNAWCQRNEGKAPKYSFTLLSDLKGEERKNAEKEIGNGIDIDDIRAEVVVDGQTFSGWGVTRSKARSRAAEDAYQYLYKQGKWLNLKDCGIEPALDTAINSLQELYQKGYIEEPTYEFEDDGEQWNCYCRSGQFWDEGIADNKKESKKIAAFGILLGAFQSAGIEKEEWWEEYDKATGEA